MSYLADTNVVSELRKRERAAPSVIKWFKAREPRELFMSVLTVGELRHGVERLRVRDPEGAAALDAWVDGVLDRYRDRLLAVDAAVAEHWSRLGVRDPLPDVDGLRRHGAGSRFRRRDTQHAPRRADRSALFRSLPIRCDRGRCIVLGSAGRESGASLAGATA